MKRQSAYANMKAGDLARITRERGLKKPDVITRSEWADFLEKDDAKRLKKESRADVAEVITDAEAADMPDAGVEAIEADEKTPTRKKGK